MRGESRANLLRRIAPLNSGVESFSVLPENNHVYERLFEAAIRTLANEVQRISRKRDTWPDASIETESLPHRDNRAEVRMALTAEFRTEFCFRLFFWFRGNRSEESQLVPGQQVDRALRQGIALAAPAVPANIGMNVFRVEFNRLENTQSLRKNLIADSISGHGDDCV